MYKLEFTLKQHTPLIHFQHDQDGATLRASEVKPKLDRFILMKLGNEDYETGRQKALENDWLIDEKKGALDYKMRITNADQLRRKVFMAFSSNEKVIADQIRREAPDVDEILSETPNFADSRYLKKRKNEDGNYFLDRQKTEITSIRRAIMVTDIMKGNYLSSFNSAMLKYISNHLQEFFLTHNFGYRQTKGFGSYTVLHIDNTEPKNEITILKNRGVTHCIGYTTSIQEVFTEIQVIHKLLKSGINFRNRRGNQTEYRKAQIFYEFAEKKIRWEKRYIKKYVNSNKIDNKALLYIDYPPTDFHLYNDELNLENSWGDIEENSAPYKYVRALLGLAEHYEFLVSHNGRQDNSTKYFVNIVHDSGDEKIERFQSPILYKVIENKVYPIPLQIPDRLWGSLFKFSYKLKYKNGGESEVREIPEPIPVPDRTEFDLEEFLKVSLENLLENCSI